MSFSSLSNEMAGTIPGLSPILADSYINRAWRDVCDGNLWSFLQQVASVVCPPQATAGTVNVTQYQSTVVCDAAASAALAAFNPVPGLNRMQIRFGGAGNTSNVGQVYSIIDADTTTTPTAYVLTLDRPVVESTNATSGYQCYRCYIRQPAEDFLAWQSIVDMVNGWRMTLNWTSTYFDAKDPQRQAQGMGYYVGAFEGNGSDQAGAQYEIWPHPTSGQTFFVRYRQRGTDFTAAADTQPVNIPDQLILERAYGWYGYPWAARNVGGFPQLRGVGWVNLILTAKANYLDLLREAKRTDNEQQEQKIHSRGHGLRDGPWGNGRLGMRGMQSGFPLDSNFIQSHLLNI